MNDPEPIRPEQASELTAVVSELRDVVRGMAAGSSPGASGAVAPSGVAALDRRMRRAQNSRLIGALVVAVVLTAIIVPNNRGGDATVASGVSDQSGFEIGDETGDFDDGAFGETGGVGSDIEGDGTAGTGDTGSTGGTGGPADGSGGAAGPGDPAPGSAPGSGGGGDGNSTSSAERTTPGVQGVTDTEIKVGVVVLDSSDLAPVCPRCGNGPTSQGHVFKAVLKAWTRDGVLPVHGRTIKFESRQTKVLDTGQRRAACVEMAQEIKPFVALVDPMGTFDVAQCIAGEFKLPAIANDSPGERVLAQIPNLYTVVDTPEKSMRNYVRWAHELGLFKGEVLGLYYPSNEDAADWDEAVNRGLKPALADHGYKLEVEVRGDQESAALAVQRFRTAGVTTAILASNRLAFQQAAKGQGYKPKYPTFDVGSLNTYTDAVSDINFDNQQMDGNLGMRTKWWNFDSRRAVAKDNPAADFCLQAYQQHTGRQLDVYENNAETQYILEACTNLQVLIEALQLAGRDLTRATFQRAMLQVKDLPTAMNPGQTFTAESRSGTAMQGTYQFRASREGGDGTAWRLIAPGWRPLWFG